jgi:hypothetical protein
MMMAPHAFLQICTASGRMPDAYRKNKAGLIARREPAGPAPGPAAPACGPAGRNRLNGHFAAAGAVAAAAQKRFDSGCGTG